RQPPGAGGGHHALRRQPQGEPRRAHAGGLSRARRQELDEAHHRLVRCVGRQMAGRRSQDRLSSGPRLHAHRRHPVHQAEEAGVLKPFIRELTQRWLLIALTILAIASVWNVIISLRLVPRIGFIDQVRGVIYDLSIGFLISYVFFLLVVALPERLTRRRTARLLKHQFRTFKLACIEIYLGAIGDVYDSDLPEKLLDAAVFRDYFSEQYSSNQNRWHAVHNGLYEYGVP